MGLLDKLKKDKGEDKKDVGEKTAKVDNAKKESVKELYKDRKTEKIGDGKSAKKIKHGSAYKILVKPLITEKASLMNSLNKYFFEVAKEANKIEVAKAIQEVYGVKPTGVNIIRMQGKTVRRGRTTGKRKDWKKAVVTLKKGESIKVYEGV